MKIMEKLYDKPSTTMKSKCIMKAILKRGKYKNGKSLKMEVKGEKNKTTGGLLLINFAKDKLWLE